MTVINGQQETFTGMLLRKNQLQGIINPLLYIAIYPQNRLLQQNRFHELGQSKVLTAMAFSLIGSLISKDPGADLTGVESQLLSIIDSFHWIKKFPPYPIVEIEEEDVA